MQSTSTGRALRLALFLAAGLCPLPAAAQAQAPAPKADAAKADAAKADTAKAALPGGAQSLSETFEDWQVACAMPQGVKRCAVGQQQADAKTRQRLLSVELQPKGTGAEGLLVMPFGLTLDKGAALRAGDADVGPALRFSTCMPEGCIVPLSLDAKALGLLRKAPTLTISAVGEGGQPVAFPVSLKGFPAAFDRAAALGS
ncbi:invasion associated locus B family protein [Xanthobacter sediminis]